MLPAMRVLHTVLYSIRRLGCFRHGTILKNEPITAAPDISDTIEPSAKNPLTENHAPYAMKQLQTI